MKIFLTGGGSGGHFYPLIAVARSIFKIAEDERIAKLKIYLISDFVTEEQKELLFKEDIKFLKVPAGKIRRYFSLLNISDFTKTFLGIVVSFFKIYQILPDIVFSKGGYSAFPVLFCAKIFRIPIIIHESDSVPGAVNRWSSKWAQKIAVSFKETIRFFDSGKTIVSGNPVRIQILGGSAKEALLHFNLEENVPVILILGGSQGATKINEVILDLLPELLEKYQIIHQTGENNYKDIKGRAGVILEKVLLKHRYHPFPFLNEGSLKNAGKIASLAISRAGAGSIFEIASWGMPSILIPLLNSAQNHQRENAYNYAGNGACEVIEEPNLKPHILFSRVDSILSSDERMRTMSEGAKAFSRPDASEVLAREIIKLGTHD